jgi:hypothetical protein
MCADVVLHAGSHSYAYIYGFYDLYEPGPSGLFVVFVTGILLSGILLLMLATSVEWMRQNFYLLFWNMHQVSQCA